MDYRTIRYAQQGAVAVITLDRPEVMNALNTAMRAEITHALRAADDPASGARVIVLTGQGAAFCSGQDLGDAASLAEVDLERVLRDEYEPLLRAICTARLPVIAAVNGTAAGAGANLALAADLVIATESAFFIEAFARIGLIPDAGGTYFLPRQIGLARAMGMALFAERIPARQAADWGLIWEAVADNDFAARWQARAAALAAIKTALRASLAHDLDAQLALEARLQGDCGKSRDFREGVIAFLEKREAGFEGR
jgi:2-(1,2-epoxy-1,2-dihydrophenyl)acetyl-CoA isomerase